MKGNHDLKWSSPFNYQPKSRALATFFFSPRTKQKKKQKKKKPTKFKSQKHTKAEKPTKRTQFPRKVLLIHDRACNI